jgi:fatty acid desaturase
MSYPIPQRANLRIITALVLAHGAVLLLLPALLLKSLWWAIIIAPFAWLNIVHWGMIHEAIHKLLLTDAKANEYGGRLLGILMGTSFHVLRFGHLMHHQMNRHWQNEYACKRGWLARLDYYYTLFAGLYISEVMASLTMAILPRRAFMALVRRTFLQHKEDAAVAGERFIYVRGNIRAVRTDMALVVLLYGAAFYYYGVYWPVLAGFMGLRMAVISFMDNIYHYATPLDNSKPGKELALPAPMSLLLLHGNYHETHHRNPDVPWTQLPSTHRAQQRQFDGDFIRHGLMQFEGPLATA